MCAKSSSARLRLRPCAPHLPPCLLRRPVRSTIRAAAGAEGGGDNPRQAELQGSDAGDNGRVEEPQRSSQSWEQQQQQQQQQQQRGTEGSNGLARWSPNTTSTPSTAIDAAASTPSTPSTAVATGAPTPSTQSTATDAAASDPSTPSTAVEAAASAPSTTSTSSDSDTDASSDASFAFQTFYWPAMLGCVGILSFLIGLVGGYWLNDQMRAVIWDAVLKASKKSSCKLAATLPQASLLQVQQVAPVRDGVAEACTSAAEGAQAAVAVTAGATQSALDQAGSAAEVAAAQATTLFSVATSSDNAVLWSLTGAVIIGSLLVALISATNKYGAMERR